MRTPELLLLYLLAGAIIASWGIFQAPSFHAGRSLFHVFCWPLALPRLLGSSGPPAAPSSAHAHQPSDHLLSALEQTITAQGHAHLLPELQRSLANLRALDRHLRALQALSAASPPHAGDLLGPQLRDAEAAQAQAFRQITRILGKAHQLEIREATSELHSGLRHLDLHFSAEAELNPPSPVPKDPP
jgi:hypothetical protein